MTRPSGWALFEYEGRLTHAVDLGQVKIICVQTNGASNGTDIRISDGPNSYWINVRNDPATCIAAIAEARKELPVQIQWVGTAPPTPSDVIPPRR